MAIRRYVIFPLFTRAYLEGVVLYYRLKTRLEVSDSAEFLIFFTKRAPDNLAPFRLKIGRTYTLLKSQAWIFCSRILVGVVSPWGPEEVATNSRQVFRR